MSAATQGFKVSRIRTATTPPETKVRPAMHKVATERPKLSAMTPAKIAPTA